MFPNLDLSRETAWMYSTLLQIGYCRLTKIAIPQLGPALDSSHLNKSSAFLWALKFTPVVLIRDPMDITRR